MLLYFFKKNGFSSEFIIFVRMIHKFCFLLSWLCFSVCAQVTIAAFEKQEDKEMTALLNKKSEYHLATQGKINGYRIKIYFGKSKEEAQQVKNRFQSKFPDIPAYDDYQLPNFIVVAGNFRTRLDALRYIKKIKPDFPTCFIIKDKIYAEP